MDFFWKNKRRKIAVSAEFDFDIHIKSHSVLLPTAQNNFFRSYKRFQLWMQFRKVRFFFTSASLSMIRQVVE
jgi:hypothetical protein